MDYFDDFILNDEVFSCYASSSSLSSSASSSSSQVSSPSDSESNYSQQITNSNAVAQRVLMSTSATASPNFENSFGSSNNFQVKNQLSVQNQIIADQRSKSFHFTEKQSTAPSYEELLELDLQDFSEKATGIDYHEYVQISEIVNATATTSEESVQSAMAADDSNLSQMADSESGITSSEMTDCDERRAVLRERNRIAARRHQQRKKSFAKMQIEQLNQKLDEKDRLEEMIERLEPQIELLKSYIHANGGVYPMDE